MTLAAANLLVAVVPMLPAHLGGLNALGVNAGGAGRFLPRGFATDLAAQGVEDLLPDDVVLPGDEVVPGGALGQQVVRQVVPLHAGPRLVEQRVDHLTQIDLARAAAGFGGQDQRLNEVPLRVSQIGAIRFPHGQVLLSVPRAQLLLHLESYGRQAFPDSLLEVPSEICWMPRAVCSTKAGCG